MTPLNLREDTAEKVPGPLPGVVDGVTIDADGGPSVAYRRKGDPMISDILGQLGTGSGLYESGSMAADTAYDLASNLFNTLAGFFASFGS